MADAHKRIPVSRVLRPKSAESRKSFQSLRFAKGRDESGALLELESNLGEDVWDGNCSDGGEVSAAAFGTAEARGDALDTRTHAHARRPGERVVSG
jgi:hypothetical protein